MDMAYKDINEFREWEKNEFGRLNWIRDSASALIGLPAIGVIVSWGIAKGAVWGASWAAIGFLTGPIQGAILCGGLAFLGAGILAMWVIPKFISGILKFFRRITEGSFNYRYNKHVAESDAKEQFEKLKNIAKEIVKLEKAELIDFKKQASKLTQGLNPVQKKLFYRLHDIAAKKSDVEKSAVERAIKTNIPIAKLRDDLAEYRLKEIRAHKKWASQAKNMEAQTAEEKKLKGYAEDVLNSVDAGRSPWAFFHFLLKLIVPKSHLLNQPETPVFVGCDIKEKVVYHPHHVTIDPNMTVQALMQREEAEIQRFADSALTASRTTMKKSPKALQADIDRLGKNKNPTIHERLELSFLVQAHDKVQDWRKTPHCDNTKAPKDMGDSSLDELREDIKVQRELNRFNFLEQTRCEVEAAQVDALCAEHAKNAPAPSS